MHRLTTHSSQLLPDFLFFFIQVQRCFGVLKRHDVDGFRKIALQTGAHLHNFHQPISSYHKEPVTDWVRRKAKRWRVWRTECEGEQRPSERSCLINQREGVFFILLFPNFAVLTAAELTRSTGWYKQDSEGECETSKRVWSLNASYYPYLRPGSDGRCMRIYPTLLNIKSGYANGCNNATLYNLLLPL